MRLFLTLWIVFSLHFATNIVREHYPAFSLIEDGDFRLDEYAGFHSDIFQHHDGHYYIGNQVTGSVIAAVPLLLFDPLLDRLEEIGRERVRNSPPAAEEYDTEYPMRRAFFRKVRERGLDLRFGASTVVTSVFLMAPLGALLAVLMLGLLRRRGVPGGRALWLALLFGLGTPVFYRSASLNHNLFFALAVFGSFLLLEGGQAPGRRRIFLAGFLAGLSLALDYAGVISLLCLFGYLLARWGRGHGPRGLVRTAGPFVLGSVPPVLFLLWSQWVTFGNPFLPGQLWMPVQNEYVTEGARGFTLPDPEVFFLNLFDLDWGLLPFAPILLFAFLPSRLLKGGPAVAPRPVRRFVLAFSLAFLLFCAANQYSRLQWNTGFRYLLPLVPFLYLLAADFLRELSGKVLGWITVPVLLHSFVLSMMRYTPPMRGDPQAVPESWRRFIREGVQFPWLKVVRSTPSLDFPLLRSPVFPYLLLFAAGLAVAAVWSVRRAGPRSAPRSPSA